MGDPMLAGSQATPVWFWDRESGQGQALVPLASKGSVPLPNGLAFFVPKVLDDGRVIRNEKSSKVMMKRFLDTVGAKDLHEVLRSLQALLKMPQKTIPFSYFEPLNRHASYHVIMQTLFNVVELTEKSRNLSAYLFVPGQVRFGYQLSEDASPEAKDAIKESPPGFLIPTWSKPNHHVRMVALTRRAKDLQPLVEAMRSGEREKDPAIIGAFAATIAELKGLARPPEEASVL